MVKIHFGQIEVADDRCKPSMSTILNFVSEEHLAAADEDICAKFVWVK